MQGKVFVSLAHATNNEAEYIGCIIGLRLALHFCHVTHGGSDQAGFADINQHNLSTTFSTLEVVGDSKLVTEQLKGNYRVNSQVSVPYE